MRSIRPIVTFIALAAIAFGVYYFLFPPADKVIRKRMGKLAEAISARPQGNIATVAKVNRIASFFHPNVSIKVEGFGTELTSVDGRGELQQMAMGARQRIGGVAVEFYNIQVQVAGKTNASATATTLVRLNDDNNPTMQEVQFEFEKLGRDWLIRSATPLKSRPQ